MAPLLIRPLAASPHLMQVADWLHGQWWGADGWSAEATAAWLGAATGPHAPVSFVAERDGEALGTATLDTDDLPARPELTPWLASVLVRPDRRRQGVASALVRAVEAHAAGLGHRELWLFTPDQSAFYAARGWRSVGEEVWHDRQVTLMRRDLLR
jgi:predicted N-acetyltransferase YhbS